MNESKGVYSGIKGKMTVGDVAGGPTLTGIFGPGGGGGGGAKAVSGTGTGGNMPPDTSPPQQAEPIPTPPEPVVMEEECGDSARDEVASIYADNPDRPAVGVLGDLMAFCYGGGPGDAAEAAFDWSDRNGNPSREFLFTWADGYDAGHDAGYEEGTDDGYEAAEAEVVEYISTEGAALIREGITGAYAIGRNEALSGLGLHSGEGLKLGHLTDGLTPETEQPLRVGIFRAGERPALVLLSATHQQSGETLTALVKSVNHATKARQFRKLLDQIDPRTGAWTTHWQFVTPGEQGGVSSRTAGSAV